MRAEILYVGETKELPADKFLSKITLRKEFPNDNNVIRQIKYNRVKNTQGRKNRTKERTNFKTKSIWLR